MPAKKVFVRELRAFFLFLILGSLIEGASLSRLFRPSLEESVELEADVMYIMGIVKEDWSNDFISVQVRIVF